MEIKSDEFFANMKSLPQRGTSAFNDLVKWEEEKCLGGVRIQGILISGWLYYYMNHWHIRVDVIDDWGNIVKKKSHPHLRDNEWIRAEALEKCRLEKLGYIEIGLRQGGKSETEAAYIGWNATLFQESQNIIVASNEGDLLLLTDKINYGLINQWEGINRGLIDKDWSKKQVRLGFKDTSNEDHVWSYIIVRNTSGGTKTEVAAGTTAKAFVYDECGKNSFSKSLEAAKPAFLSEFGWRVVPMLVGCVCAGTKVWNNKGDLVNIEDLKTEEGILGYNGETISKEKITYQQEVVEKSCYRITTNKGTSLECSEDHPILFRSRNEVSYNKISKKNERNLYFKETKDLQIGNQIALIEEVNIFGNKQMWEPRLVGWLIGDGSYGIEKTPRLSNCDDYVNNYIESNFKTVLERSHITKENKLYKETRIKNICPKLRELGIYGQTKDKKTLPINIHSYSKKHISELLGGFFDTDGCVPNTKKSPPTISLCSAYKNLLLEVKLLLQKFGIHGNINFHKPNFNNPKDRNGSYTLDIGDRKSILRFHKEIKFTLSYKQDNLEKIVKLLENKKNQIPKEVKGLRFERIISIEYIGIKPVYNLTADTTNTYIANGIITHNTGGSFENGDDAKRYFFNPSSNKFLGFIDPIGRETGLFLSGEYRQDCKEWTTLRNYLNTEKGMNLSLGDLDNIPIKVSNKERAREIILLERKQKAKDPDRSELLKKIMYEPLSVDECFLTDSQNNFPIDAILRKQLALRDYEPNYVELYRDNENKVRWKFSDNKPISIFPVSPKDIKEQPIPPVVINEHPEFNVPHGTYCIGIDPYNEDESSAKVNSLGTICVYKRMYTPVGEFQNSIVATWAGRCKEVKQFHQLCLDISEYYNAIDSVLPENEDKTLIQFFFYKKKGHFLAESFELAKQLNQNTKSRRDKGLSAATPNQRHYMNLMVSDAKDEIYTVSEEGEEQIRIGVDKIPDPMLLEEMRLYKGKAEGSKGVHDGNYDRIISYGLALTLARYYDVKYPSGYWKPKEDEDRKEERPKKIHTPFGSFTKQHNNLFIRPNNGNRKHSNLFPR